jgi:hypothetical protein
VTRPSGEATTKAPQRPKSSPGIFFATTIGTSASFTTFGAFLACTDLPTKQLQFYLRRNLGPQGVQATGVYICNQKTVMALSSNEWMIGRDDSGKGPSYRPIPRAPLPRFSTRRPGLGLGTSRHRPHFQAGYWARLHTKATAGQGLGLGPCRHRPHLQAGYWARLETMATAG